MKFGIVGGGWRAQFYLRIARDLPERFGLAGVVVRDAAKREALVREWGAPVFASVEELLQTKPDFVVTSISWDDNPGLLGWLAERGVPALSETPVAATLEAMRAVTALVQAGAKLQVAEQYLFQPLHAARLRVIEMGLLGTVREADVSVAHGYHGISLMRRFLGVGLRLPRVTARKFASQIVAGPTRQGLPERDEVVESSRVIAQFDYGDKLGIFDFCRDQYFSWIRSPRVMVRGERGEINGEVVRTLEDYRTPQTFALGRHDTGHRGNLEGFSLRAITGCGREFYRNPFEPARWSDDEIAVATSLARMANYLETGEPCYPAAEGCHDRYLDLLVERSLAEGGMVEGEAQPWM